MQQNTRTASLVEAGVLSAIAIVFALINLYVPLLGFFLNIFWPVPLVILGVRHGLRWSALSLVTAGVIVALLVNPLESVFLSAGLGFIGLTLGWGIHKGNAPVVVLGLGAIASFLSKLLVFGLSFGLMGINPLDISADVSTKATDAVVEFYRSAGFPAAELERIGSMAAVMLDMMKLILPAGVILASFFDTFVNFWLSRKILHRLGTFIPGLPDFKDVVFPPPVLLFYGLSLLTIQLWQPQDAYYRVAANFNVLCMVFLLIQGLAVSWFFIHARKWPGFLRGLIIASLFATPFMTMAMVILGMADFIMDFRKLRPRR